MDISKENTVGEIVANDYRTAAVFESYGIDFCCKGNRPLQAVCEKENIDFNRLQEELNKTLLTKEGSSSDFNSWPLDLLADYVEKTHHRYVKEKIPLLQQYLAKICQAHGKQHPELFDIAELFNESASEFTAHMQKEENILFPFIRKLEEVQQGNKPLGAVPFGSVQNPVQMMMHEHDAEGERFRNIAALSNNYTTPADGCNTYKVTFALLKEFEADLHKHIHLENNILFPKSIELEKVFVH